MKATMNLVIELTEEGMVIAAEGAAEPEMKDVIQSLLENNQEWCDREAPKFKEQKFGKKKEKKETASPAQRFRDFFEKSDN